MTLAPSVAVDRTRTVEVRSPTARRETAMALKAAFHVAYWSALVIFGHASASAAREGDASDRPFADLDAADQRTFRAVQEGLAEAERRRSRSGAWPSVEALASDGVPPFAKDPLDRAGYVWLLTRDATLVNYVGTPMQGSARPAFVVILAEPWPGLPPDTSPVDEIHHRLADGTLLHATVWMGPPLTDGARPKASLNPTDGYRRIVVRGAPKN